MDRDEAATLAAVWWSAVDQIALLRDPPDRTKALLTELLLAVADSPGADAAHRAGEQLVELNVADPLAIVRTAEVFERIGAQPARTATLVGAFAQGFSDAMRRRTLVSQESLQHSIAVAGHEAAAAIRASDARFRIVFENASAAIVVGTVDAVILEANPAALAMVGRTLEDVRGMSVFELVHPVEADEVDAINRRVAGDDPRTVRHENRYLRADGSYGWISFALTHVVGYDDLGDYLLLVGEDVTDRRRMQAELERQARHDQLTGLPNRLFLTETVHRAVERAVPGDRIGLCFIDLDGFKEVNDKYGHGVGDELLATIGARLHDDSVAEGYFVARIGGDEFVTLIVPPTDEHQVTAVAESALALLSKPFDIAGRDLSVSASIGALVATACGSDADRLLDFADVGLYRAKADGRGRIFLHVP